MIIDAHTHCFPEHIAARAIPMLAARAKIRYYVDGTVPGLFDSMELSGVDISLIQNIATKPDQVQNINNWAGQIQSERIRCFGTVHPDYADWSKEIERIAHLGMIGIKFHPDYQDFDVDDDRMLPLYEKTAQTGLMLLFHAGLDVGFGEPVRCQPKALAQVVRRLPNATIIGAHMGGFARWEEALEHLAGQNIYLDTSYSFDYAPRELLLEMIKIHGPERILFASDSPWGDQRQELEHIRSLPLEERERELILGKNMERLIKMHS
jgi:predicted TIM-barrel fold metal-dependent hydrolase